jgi:phospho-N-acetylmuramoyl-pentapeptide-transferase
MLYHLFHYLEQFNVPGARLFDYISFRSGFALILSLFIATVIGRHIIERLQLMQVGEIVRNLGLEGQMQKKGTPTMGGIIIIISILIPCLLLGKLNNVYMILMIVATLWTGLLGFADDYIKVAHHNKAGMKGKFKIVGQVGLGIIVGLTMYFSPAIVMSENGEQVVRHKTEYVTTPSTSTATTANVVAHKTVSMKSTQTTIPFVKNNNFDYAYLTKWMGSHAQTGGWIVFILVTIFVIAAVSNGANLTDGLDGLATGTSAIIGVALAIMCYLGGNVIYSSYLNIMYIPDSGELVVYAAAFIGATIGFLWYNSYPAQVFMGDTGSLCLGGIIAVFAILIRKELLIPILCAIFFVEDLSVMIQVSILNTPRNAMARASASSR